MKYPASYLLLMVGVLSCFPGCNRYGPWFKKYFKEASTCDICELSDAQAAIRREPVYQPYAWKTVDILYAIPINELVTCVRERLSCCGAECPVAAEQKTDKKKIERAQSRFYVMMDGDKDAWCFVLSVDGDCTYKASSVKARELDRGMKGILIDQLVFKKNVFEVTFDTVVGNRACDLIASNGTYQVTLSWESFETKRGVGHEGTQNNPQRMDTFF